jgi:hypothetical protein
VTAFEARVLDVGTGGFRHTQPVQGEQRNQRVFCGRAETGGGEEASDLVAVQGCGV